MANFNPGATGNPLDALLAGGSLYGSSGFNIGAALGQARAGTIDPRLAALGYGRTSYDDTYQFNPTDPNIDPTNGYINLNGKTYTQLGNTGVGGPGQVIDPSLVIKNDKYGLLSPVDNIKSFGNDIGGWGPFALAAIPAIAIAAGAAAGGAGASAGGTAAAGTTAEGAAGGFGMVAPGMEAQAAMESQLLNAGILPGTTEWTSALSAAGLDTTGGLGAGAGTSGTGMSAGTTATSGSSGNFLSTLNKFRSAMGLANGLMGGKSGGSGMDIGSILGLLGLGHQALGGGIGTASGAQAAGKQAAGMADPWAQYRDLFAKGLTPDVVNKLINPDPSAVLSDPGFQFARDQGINTINMGDAAQGTLRSGNRLAELQKFGTGLASQYEQQYRNNNFMALNELSNLAGVNAGSPAAAGQMVMGGFDNASNLRNSATNGLFAGGNNSGINAISSILGMLGKAGSGIGDWFSSLFGDSGGLSDSQISDLVGSVGGGTTSDALFGGADLGSGFGDAFAGV